MNKIASNKDELVFVPLGGAGEIGMNLYLYGYGTGNHRKWLMVDLGVSFAGPKEPGINLIFPDISFLEERKDQITGLFITHAHEDHIGAVPYLWPRLQMPVFASPFAGMMLKGKLLERDLYADVSVQMIKPGGIYTSGPFEIEPFQVTHSIPESLGFIIKVGGKTIVHSGDWRTDETPVLDDRTDFKRLAEIGQEGCDFLICDSTNVLSDKTSLSEKQVADNLKNLVARAPARIVVTTFASNVGRISSLIKAAHESGRHIVLSGRAMERTVMLARELGILKDMPSFVPVEEFENLPRDKVMVVCTGSQGEARAQCARIAAKTHPDIELDEGDWVIFSSKTIPGNERDVLAVENQLARQGVRVITSEIEPIHETGHPRRGELQKLYEALSPSCLVPMHGEARHLLAHASFALKKGIKRQALAYNGDVLKLSPGDPEIIGGVKSGRLYEDGYLITEAEFGPVKERRKLSYVGCVSMSLVISDRGDLTAGPIIVCDGIPEHDAAGSFIEDLLCEAALAGFESVPRKSRAREDELSEIIRRAVRRQANMIWGKKPKTYIHVHVV